MQTNESSQTLVRLVAGNADFQAALQIRFNVFVREQKVPPELETDELMPGRFTSWLLFRR